MEETQMVCIILNSDEFPRLQCFHSTQDQALHFLKEFFHPLLRGQGTEPFLMLECEKFACCSKQEGRNDWYITRILN